MLKRTLVFSSPMILSLKNQQLVLAYKDSPDEKQTVPIEDVGVVLLEHQQTSVTLPLLNALAENEVQVVICNDKGMPNALISQSFTLQVVVVHALNHRTWHPLAVAYNDLHLALY